MKYDFTTLVNRRGTGSSKWEAMLRDNPSLPEEIVPLSVADMEFVNPPQLKEGLKKYIDESILGYTKATDEYYEAVIDWMGRRHNYAIKKEWIVTTSGIVTAIFNGIRKFTKPGEGVITMSPVYYPFFMAVEKNERSLADCPLIEQEGDYRIDFDLLKDLAKKKANTLLLFCSPHNPVGRVWTREELEKLAKIVVKNDLFLISDEIHHDLVMPGTKHPHIAIQTVDKRLEERMMTCTAPSKTFNIAGLGISNIIIPHKGNRDRFEEGLVEVAAMNTMMGYKACEICYEECEDWLEECIEVIDKNQRMVQKFFENKYPTIKAPLVEGTYLQWIDFRALNLNSEELEKMMKEEAFLYLDEGYIFGKAGEGFERINLACPSHVMEEALERLDQALAKRI